MKPINVAETEICYSILANWISLYMILFIANIVPISL